MAGKTRKSRITPQQSLDWLRRYEDGESPPSIANKDQVDVRTVRKHIELAKQETEVKEARSMVLRNALERHYQDLCDYARTLATYPSGEATGAQGPYSEHMRNALRQHIPRSPIWGYLNQRDTLEQGVAQLTGEIESRIEELVRSDPRFSTGLIEGYPGPIDGLIEALKFQAGQWAKGYRGLDIEENLHTEPVGEGLVNFRYGAFGLVTVEQSHLRTVPKVIREVLQDSELRLKELEELKKLENSLLDLTRVEKNLNDEIAVITLRRVIPGRCHYCPL
jgi:signal transduction histidine kinase